MEQITLELNWFTVLTAYLILINLYAFFIFGFDKSRSTQPGASRIRERTLWISMLAGGSIGALFGMHFFRHKTKKISFQSIAALILALQILLLIFYFKNTTF